MMSNTKTALVCGAGGFIGSHPSTSAQDKAGQTVEKREVLGAWCGFEVSPVQPDRGR